jgi:hypothetical protein
MSETQRLGLPLLQPSQAQKHVTVNEALVRVDALAQLVLKSVTTGTPPASPVEGEAWGVPGGAVNAWAGQDGGVAVHVNGGWIFVDPVVGWRAWVDDEGVEAVWTGAEWLGGAISLSPAGSGFQFRSDEIDHPVTAGPGSTTAIVFPSHSLVFGVTARVLSDLGGAATGWQLGVAGSPDRYGSGLGVSTGSWARGLTSTPIAYYSDTALDLTAEGGDFGSGGTVRLVVHYAELSLPNV